MRGQPALAETQVVEQAEAGFADEAGALRDTGQRGRQRRFPGPRHHQGLAVSFRPQPRGERAMLRPKARRVRGRSATMPLRTPGM